MAISIDFQGYEKVLQKIQQYPNNKKRAVKLILEKAAFNIQNNARQILVRQTKQSKNLHNQIQSQSTTDGAMVFVKSEYAPYVEFGTGAGATAYVSRLPDDFQKYAMTFKSTNPFSGYKPVFIDHAGFKGWRMVKFPLNLKAQPFMYPAYKEEKPKITKLVKNACSKP